MCFYKSTKAVSSVYYSLDFFYAQDLFISKSHLNYYIHFSLKDTFGVDIFTN